MMFAIAGADIIKAQDYCLIITLLSYNVYLNNEAIAKL